MEEQAKNNSQKRKAAPVLAWRITGAALVLIGDALLVFATALPFVFGIILILAGILMFLKDKLDA